VSVKLYIWQRGTAALMVPLVAIHLAVMFYATRQGLSAADILGRTRGSLVWVSFYGAFVIAAAIHAAIGVRTILVEWLSLRDPTVRILSSIFGVVLLALGARAVFAVVFA